MGVAALAHTPMMERLLVLLIAIVDLRRSRERHEDMCSARSGIVVGVEVVFTPFDLLGFKISEVD